MQPHSARYHAPTRFVVRSEYEMFQSAQVRHSWELAKFKGGYLQRYDNCWEKADCSDMYGDCIGVVFCGTFKECRIA